MKTPNKLKANTIGPTEDLLTAIQRLNSSQYKFLAVINDSSMLLGSITDGDIRRAILKKTDLHVKVAEVMNPSPVFLIAGFGERELEQSLKRTSGACVPVVDKNHTLIGLSVDLEKKPDYNCNTTVVIMAGGLGTRLRPLTDDTPKPLLEVQGRAIIAHILDRLIQQGLTEIFISVNYHADQIINFCGDGTNIGANIRYVREKKRLGTGGALSLLPINELQNRLIVMNGDVITDLNFGNLLGFHESEDSVATMGVYTHLEQFPYGIVRNAGSEFLSLDEKPTLSYLVNAGIYALDKNVVTHIPRDEYFDLPTLFEMLTSAGMPCRVFPINERWRDLGEWGDLERARNDKNFSKE